MLLVDQQLRIADDVDKEDVGNFRPNFLLNFSGHFVARLEGRDTNIALSVLTSTRKASEQHVELIHAAARSEHGDFLFQFTNALSVCFNRFDESIKCRMQIVIARVGKRNSQLCGRVADEIEVLFFG